MTIHTCTPPRAPLVPLGVGTHPVWSPAYGHPVPAAACPSPLSPRWGGNWTPSSPSLSLRLSPAGDTCLSFLPRSSHRCRHYPFAVVQAGQ